MNRWPGDRAGRSAPSRLCRGRQREIHAATVASGRVRRDRGIVATRSARSGVQNERRGLELTGRGRSLWPPRTGGARVPRDRHAARGSCAGVRGPLAGRAPALAADPQQATGSRRLATARRPTMLIDGRDAQQRAGRCSAGVSSAARDRGWCSSTEASPAGPPGAAGAAGAQLDALRGRQARIRRQSGARPRRLRGRGSAVRGPARRRRAPGRTFIRRRDRLARSRCPVGRGALADGLGARLLGGRSARPPGSASSSPTARCSTSVAASWRRWSSSTSSAAAPAPPTPPPSA